MDTRTGNLYPSKEAALAAGVLAADLVEMTGEPKAIKRAARKVRMASRHENARRKARRKQQKQSRSRNR
jgi:hypothetical protein